MRLTKAAAAVAAAAMALAVAAPGALAGTRHDVRVARAATDAYHSHAAVIQAGYAMFKDKRGIACIAMKGSGGMGIHLVDGTLVDGKIALRHPEAVVYRLGYNGHLRLAALEYVVTVSAWRDSHGQDAPRPRLYGHRFNFTPAGNRFGLPAYYSLHAWIWYDNPAGMFSMWNPRVHCPPGV
ncbi:MAG TPA: hypothetical protein VFJ19_15565 [Nocardioidaceae bacterium]|nr:hypothetical protein [Nocardioidaceae bacterium]